jgi:hypothetical protein
LMDFLRVHQHLGFKELEADSQCPIIVNPKYGVAAMSGGFFREIWP